MIASMRNTVDLRKGIFITLSFIFDCLMSINLFRKMLQYFVLKLTMIRASQVEQFITHICKRLIKTLSLGSRFAVESIHRLLTLWLNFKNGEQGVVGSKAMSSINKVYQVLQ